MSLRVFTRALASSPRLSASKFVASRGAFRREFSAECKAIVFEKHGRPLDVLKIHTFPLPDLADDSILVKFLAAPINPADINQVEGVYPLKPPFQTSALATETPLALGGNEGVVEVIDVGKGVQDFKPGDRAIMRHTIFGTWRTKAVATIKDLTKIPYPSSEITAVQAATASVNPTTAYNMLQEFADLKPGDWFIQTGANSGVGRAAIQLGRLWGLKSINVVRNRDDLAELKKDLESLGATKVITDEELADKGFRSVIKEWVGKSPIKLALNCTGGESTTNMARQLSEGGHLVTYGGMARKPVTLPVSLFIFKDITSHGYWLSRWSDAHPDEKEKIVNEIFSLIKAGELKDVPVDKWVWKETMSDEELLEVFKKGVSTYIEGAKGRKQVLVI
ncbi:enoyl-acyl-carrier-proteinreductase 1 mitochondrial precursor, partial [Myxozyma melibiosi]